MSDAYVFGRRLTERAVILGIELEPLTIDQQGGGVVLEEDPAVGTVGDESQANPLHRRVAVSALAEPGQPHLDLVMPAPVDRAEMQSERGDVVELVIRLNTPERRRGIGTRRARA